MGGFNCVFFGDFLQLPPIGPKRNLPFIFKRIDNDKRSRIFGGGVGLDLKLFAKFNFSELTMNMRQQKALAFKEVLDRVRIGSPTDEDLDLLKTRLVSVEPADSPTERAAKALLSQLDKDPQAVCLLPTVEASDAINRRMLELLQLNTITIQVLGEQ